MKYEIEVANEFGEFIVSTIVDKFTDVILHIVSKTSFTDTDMNIVIEHLIIKGFYQDNNISITVDKQ